MQVLCQAVGMDSIIEPQLAPPGAGLPAVELVIARMLFNWQRATGNRASFTAHFQSERAKINQLTQGLKHPAAARRILIPRLPGMEDSSRNWSVWMTLDHLRIIHGGIIDIISSLAKDVVPPGQASTATVKPSPDVTGAVVVAYEKSCDDLIGLVTSIPNLKTKARFSHPWFGPLDAAGWHAMAGTHIAIHRKQIQKIVARLGV